MTYERHEPTIIIGWVSEWKYFVFKDFDNTSLYYEYKSKHWSKNDLENYFAKYDIDYIEQEYTNRIYYWRIVRNIENWFVVKNEDVWKNIYFVY